VIEFAPCLCPDFPAYNY